MAVIVGHRDASAMENGATQWPSGVQTVIPAILPAPGETALYNYSLYYHADSFKDQRGRDLIPGFDLSVAAEAPRIVHTWKAKLGPMNMSSAVVLAGNYLKVEQTPVPGIHLEDSTFGLNFLYLTPLYLTYNTPSLHVEIGPSVFIPAGQYDRNDLANPTVNYYAFQQELSATYFPTKRLELSTLAVLDVNAENPDTDYRSGSFISVDWGVNWAPFASSPTLFFGVGGYYLRQFTDDEINGVTVQPGGFRLRRAAIGPQLVYYFSEKSGIAAKYQREFETENGPEGDRFWVQFVIPINKSR
jgi:hypothetical protein